jgi:hypothetical protein
MLAALNPAINPRPFSRKAKETLALSGHPVAWRVWSVRGINAAEA